MNMYGYTASLADAMTKKLGTKVTPEQAYVLMFRAFCTSMSLDAREIQQEGRFLKDPDFPKDKLHLDDLLNEEVKLFTA